MELSCYWAERSKKAFGLNPHKGIFGIVQGGLFEDLRIKSLEKLIEIDFVSFFCPYTSSFFLRNILIISNRLPLVKCCNFSFSTILYFKHNDINS